MTVQTSLSGLDPQRVSRRPLRRADQHGISRRQAVSLVERRRRFALLKAVGTALLLAGLTAGLLLALSPSRPYQLVVAAHAVAAGQQIKAADVRLAQVADPALRTGASGQMAAVVGRYSLIDLPAGAAIPLSAVSSDEPLPAGYTVISLPSASSSAGLRYGQRLSLRIGSQAFPAILKSVPPSGQVAGQTTASSLGADNRAESRLLVAVEAEQARSLLALAAKEPVFIVTASD